MNSEPSVQVLLATYNGARYLRQQIDSILAQTHRNLTIVARDDGSTDGTQAILDEYQHRFPSRFTILPTDAPTGSARSNFARLIAASTAPYLACADQDDVWLPEKIALSVQALQALERSHPPERPLLVFTDLRVVDAGLRDLRPSFWAHQVINPANIHRLPRLLMQNVVTGCTMLFNRALADLAVSIPPAAYMHDWWIALIASALGAAVYVEQPTVLYRQHEYNVVGAAEHSRVTGIPHWRQHQKRRVQWETIEHQTAAFLERFGPMLDGRTKRLLEALNRCGNSPNRLTRVSTYLANGFSLTGWRANAAILWYLWDMQAAKRGY